MFLPDTNKNAISGWQWPVSREQLEAIKKPVILYAIGYNYFRGQEPNDLFLDNLGRILEKADFAGIRNHGSIDRINELTGNRFKDKICFQPCPTTIIRKIYPEYHHNGKERKKLAVNIAFDRYSIRFGNTIYKTLESIAKALREFEKLGYEILNVSHISADEKFGIVLDHFGIKYKTVRLQHNFPKEVFRFYAGVDLVLGMRGHAQMIPFGLGTPIISLGTHDKMKWFLEDIGSTDWYIDLNQKDGEVDKLILEKFSGIIDNKQNVLDRMKKEQDRLFAITMENLGLIEKLVNGNLN